LPAHFGLLLQGEGTYEKKLDVKTFPFNTLFLSNKGQ